MTQLPLCVDLDGTLILSDVFRESVKQLLSQKLWVAALFPYWLVQGRAAFKRQVALRTHLDASKLPYNALFLAWLKEERAAGRRIILATASDQILADDIQRHLGLFDQAIGSDGSLNLKAENKLRRLQSQFGNAFEYAGNSSADLPVWQHCQSAVVVNASARVLARAQAIGRVTKVFPRLPFNSA